MTAEPTAAWGAAAAVRSRPRAVSTAPISQDMTVMLHRLVAGYAVVGLLPGLPALVRQAPVLPGTWLVAVVAAQTVVVAVMLVLAVLGHALGRWLVAFSVLTLVAVLSLAALGASARPLAELPFLWFHVGLAVVCACVWGGARLGMTYAVVLAAAWTLLRLLPAGGAAGVDEAVSEGFFGGSAGLVVGVVALGMLRSARAADRVAVQLREAGLTHAVERAVADERARLDQLIHDDVMTTLTAAGHSTDAATGRATANLARETLDTLDGLDASTDPGAALSVSVLASLTEQTVRHVSPDVAYEQEVEVGVAALRVPGAAAQTLLSALREGVRNAVRHSGASAIEAGLEARQRGQQLRLQAHVRDDGHGFAPGRLPGDRLGVRVSMLEASRQSGLEPRLVSSPGRGTVFTLTWTGQAGEVSRLLPEPVESEPRLPVDFPAARFSAATWAALAVNLGVGLLTAPHYRSSGALVLAMVLAVAATALVLRPGGRLRLPAASAVAVVVLVAALSAVMLTTVPRPAAGLLVWHLFPVQLVLVTLVVRRRPGWAVASLVALEASIVWWCLSGPDGWDGVLGWGSGPVFFVGMALLVNRVLLAISRRQAALRQQEDAAIDASVRRHVAVVQRALWVADLRSQTRSILERLSAVDGAVPDVLRDDALVVEATLRESLVARNVMSEELAGLTEGARRRGVEVRLVDSRHTHLPPVVAQAVLDAVRRGLAADAVSRLVVRLAPEEGPSSASVLTEDAEGTHLVRLDPAGTPITSEVEARGR